MYNCTILGFSVTILTAILKLPNLPVSINQSKQHLMSKVKDLLLASWGRKELELAEV
jgi:hypothetical protein